MTKSQLIEIAKVGFPDRVKQFIDFNKVDIHSISGVHRLYDGQTPFEFMLPKNYHLSVFIGDDNFVQIESLGKAFNHNAAIKKMEELNLI